MKISVGGTPFETRLSVLTSDVAKDTMLGAMFSGRHRVDFDEKTGAVLIDSGDTEVFQHVLNFLRDPIAFEIDPSKYNDDQRASLCKRAQFYNMPVEFYHRLTFVTLESIQFGGCLVLNNYSGRRQHKIESASTRTRS